MEEKKPIKMGLKVLIGILILITIIIVILFIYNSKEKVTERLFSETIKIKTYKNEDYYIITSDYMGEYDLQEKKLSNYYNMRDKVNEFEKKEIMSYEEYEVFCNEWDIEKKYSDDSKKYVVFSVVAHGSPIIDARLADVKYNRNIVEIYLWDKFSGVTADISAYCLIIPIKENINNINIIGLYTEEEFNNIKKYNTTYNPDKVTLDKPIIYLYPTEEIEVEVKLKNNEKITCSYPKYIDGWNVLAKPNGDLIDLDTKRNLYSLYYESENVKKFEVSKDGFVIKGEESVRFLEEKLAILGLNERETEEFIIYWLPKLESNKYNYIRFATEEEINENMPLEINPTPDNIIRVLMIFKGLEKPIDVNEQKLDTPQRKGFTVVEWGGTQI